MSVAAPSPYIACVPIVYGPGIDNNVRGQVASKTHPKRCNPSRAMHIPAREIWHAVAMEGNSELGIYVPMIVVPRLPTGCHTTGSSRYSRMMCNTFPTITSHIGSPACGFR